MKNISGIVLGVLVMVLTLIMMPMLLTANDAILVAENATVNTMTGLAQVAGVGPIIILVGLLAAGGLFTLSGARGRGTAGRGEIIKVVGSIVALLVALIMFGIILSATDTLASAVTGGQATAMKAIVCIIPLIAYVGILAGVGYVQVAAVRKVRRSRRFIA